jgi:hypothetical protein
MFLLLFLLLSSAAAANTILGWAIYAIFTIVFVFLLTSLILKRLMPALNGATALELDELGLNDYIRNVSIAWADIEAISLARGRSAATIRLNLKWESTYGSTITIPLRWIKGKDDDIYNAVMVYFEYHKANL